MRVIALDPGVTTGVAYGTLRDGQMTVFAEQWEWDHIQLYGKLLDYNPDVIVCESFEYRAKARVGLNLYPVELIGVVKLYAGKELNDGGGPTLCMQTAAKGKGYYSDTHLKNNGVYVRGVGHGMDALRHLLQWYTFGPGYKYNQKGFQ